MKRFACCKEKAWAPRYQWDVHYKVHMLHSHVLSSWTARIRKGTWYTYVKIKLLVDEIMSLKGQYHKRSFKFLFKKYATIIKVHSVVNKITFKRQIGINSFSKRSMTFSDLTPSNIVTSLLLICSHNSCKQLLWPVWCILDLHKHVHWVFKNH